jgi:RNA polymerase sigma-70 factor, ECF subfamily
MMECERDNLGAVRKPTPPEVERRIRAASERRDHAAATTIAVEAYGPEILGFLATLLDDPGAADDVFSVFCEDVWRGIGGFAWRCSARCWCYTLARNAAMRFLRSPHERSVGQVPLSAAPEIAQLTARVRRSSTAKHLRSEVKSRMRELRERLPLEEQMLLILRVDKELPWDEVARVLGDDDDLVRASARARKRFQLVKDELKRLAHEAGLL